MIISIPPISTKRAITSQLTHRIQKHHYTWRWKSRSWLGTG